MKTLPKSLHTVTAWTNAARYFMAQGNDAKTAALRAECLLGLETMADYYNLKSAVLKQLSKGQP